MHAQALLLHKDMQHRRGLINTQGFTIKYSQRRDKITLIIMHNSTHTVRHTDSPELLPLQCCRNNQCTCTNTSCGMVAVHDCVGCNDDSVVHACEMAAKVVEVCNANYIGARAGPVQVCHSSSTAHTAQLSSWAQLWRLLCPCGSPWVLREPLWRDAWTLTHHLKHTPLLL